jgi:hypothetical protein
MILAYNTSLADLHIGLFSDEAAPLAEFHHSPTKNDRGIHDALLAKKTSELLKEISASAKDISRLTFINGPGSFTGLRIGLAFAKGMVFGLNSISPVGRTRSPSLIPLLAHEVLLQKYISQFTILNSQFSILYPGYEKDSVYMSSTDDPKNIRYIKISELEKMNTAEIICTSELRHIPLPHHIVSIELQTIAQMAISGHHTPFVGDNIGALEPFYGTDFKPGK